MPESIISITHHVLLSVLYHLPNRTVFETLPNYAGIFTEFSIDFSGIEGRRHFDDIGMLGMACNVRLVYAYDDSV
jgi:hypothetical protein